MNQTEIAVTLLSFIYVLALTHILQCFRDLWIARKRVEPSASLLRRGWWRCCCSPSSPGFRWRAPTAR